MKQQESSDDPFPQPNNRYPLLANGPNEPPIELEWLHELVQPTHGSREAAMSAPREANDCECLIECDGVGSLAAGEQCRAARLRAKREVAMSASETTITLPADGEYVVSIGPQVLKRFIARKGERVQLRLASTKKEISDEHF